MYANKVKYELLYEFAYASFVFQWRLILIWRCMTDQVGKMHNDVFLCGNNCRLRGEFG